MSSKPPRDAVSSIADLIAHGITLAMVRWMPPELGGWCVDDDIVYVQADPPWSPGNCALRDAIGHLTGPTRRHLVALSGGLLDSPTVPMRATGSGR